MLLLGFRLLHSVLVLNAKPLYHHRSKLRKFAVFKRAFSSCCDFSICEQESGCVCVCASRLNKSIHMQAKTQPKWFFVQVLSPREFKPRKFLIRTCGTKLSTSLLLALYLHSPLDVLEVTTRQVLFRTEKVSLNVFGLSFWKEPLLHDGRKVHWFSHTQSK